MSLLVWGGGAGIYQRAMGREDVNELEGGNEFRSHRHAFPRLYSPHRISAKNDQHSQWGELSAPITGYVASLPGKPTHLAFPAGTKSNTRTSVEISWRAPALDTGLKADTIVYRLEIDDGLGGDFHISQHLRLTRASITGLRASREYRIRVCAENFVGLGPYTTPITQRAAQVPAQMAAPTVSSRAAGRAGELTLTWIPPSDDGGAAVEGYRVIFDSTCEKYEGANDPQLLKITVSCVPGAVHGVQVQAKNAVGWSELSGSISRTCGSEPTAPYNVRLDRLVPTKPIDMVDTRTPATVTLRWEQPKQNGGADVKNYYVYRDEGDADELYKLVCITNYLKCTVVGLVNGRNYKFYVVAENAVGKSPRSAIFLSEMKCTPRAPFAAPQLKISQPAAISILWLPPVSDCGSPLTGYRLYRNEKLVHPISNTITEQPTVNQDSIAQSQLQITFSVGQEVGDTEKTLSESTQNFRRSCFLPCCWYVSSRTWDTRRGVYPQNICLLGSEWKASWVSRQGNSLWVLGGWIRLDARCSQVLRENRRPGLVEHRQTDRSVADFPAADRGAHQERDVGAGTVDVQAHLWVRARYSGGGEHARPHELRLSGRLFDDFRSRAYFFGAGVCGVGDRPRQ